MTVINTKISKERFCFYVQLWLNIVLSPILHPSQTIYIESSWPLGRLYCFQPLLSAYETGFGIEKNENLRSQYWEVGVQFAWFVCFCLSVSGKRRSWCLSSLILWHLYHINYPSTRHGTRYQTRRNHNWKGCLSACVMRSWSHEQRRGTKAEGH